MSVDAIAKMALELSRLPGIGMKSAQRLAYHIAAMPEDQVKSLASALYNGRKAIRYCPECFGFSEGGKCAICADPERRSGQICVVKEPKDVAALERVRDYKGVYHVLGGTLSPMNDIGPDDLRIRELMQRLADSSVQEVILATNPDIEGEATATYLAQMIKPLGIKVSRIAHGVPVGGDLEYTDEVTLSKALEGRREM